ncbi:alpha/beta hydrolase [Myxococcota bacterium]|nr:alpha/beta hydrolase [Myxococcota bacterium]
MESVTAGLAERSMATLRYAFPYVERGRRAPSPRSVLLATVRSAVDAAAAHCGDLPLLAGGKSMGGRMTSLAASQERLPNIEGLIFCGFPLHPAGKPSAERGEHLFDVQLPLLFLQGTRDKLAEIERMERLCADLGTRATLHVTQGGDHGFHVLKRSGRNDEQVMDELCERIVSWAAERFP